MGIVNAIMVGLAIVVNLCRNKKLNVSNGCFLVEITI